VLHIAGPVDMATFYVQPDVGVVVMEEVAKKRIPEVWLNPGADAPRVVQKARSLGVEPILACSIIGIGESPSDY
jgi:predicted CoA-binding protein